MMSNVQFVQLTVSGRNMFFLKMSSLKMGGERIICDYLSILNKLEKDDGAVLSHVNLSEASWTYSGLQRQ